jgi:Pyridoxamine 5'-phosphate oxidase
MTMTSYVWEFTWPACRSRYRPTMAIRGTSPVVESIRLPKAYGVPTQLLPWAEVDERLNSALHYWLATTRPDGRPHVVPVDGIWLDRACYFGGDPETVHARNLQADPRAAIHLDDSEAATIAEGVADIHTPTPEFAGELAAAAKRKYGYSVGADVYLGGVWRLRPTTVLAWTRLYRDATRFRFAS